MQIKGGARIKVLAPPPFLINYCNGILGNLGMFD